MPKARNCKKLLLLRNRGSNQDELYAVRPLPPPFLQRPWRPGPGTMHQVPGSQRRNGITPPMNDVFRPVLSPLLLDAQMVFNRLLGMLILTPFAHRFRSKPESRHFSSKAMRRSNCGIVA